MAKVMCSNCNGHGSVPPTRMICPKCKGARFEERKVVEIDVVMKWLEDHELDLRTSSGYGGPYIDGSQMYHWLRRLRDQEVDCGQTD